MIAAKNVTFSYPNGQQAIKNLTITIDSEATVLIGPNGAGKTTLLKILALIYKPQKGEIIIDGKSYWQLSKRERLETRRKIVYLHEKPKLFTGTVLDNVTYPLLIRGYTIEEAREMAINMLKELDVEHLAERKREELSAGEAQLIAYARATIIKPKYLLIDEPTNTLDQQKRIKLVKHLKKLTKQGTKIIIATHDRLLAIKLAKKIILLDGGQIAQEITPRYLIQEIERELKNF